MNSDRIVPAVLFALACGGDPSQAPFGEPGTTGPTDPPGTTPTSDPPTPPTVPTTPPATFVPQVNTFTGRCADQYSGDDATFDFVWPAQLAVGDHTQVTLYQVEHPDWDAWAAVNMLGSVTESAVLVTSQVEVEANGDITTFCQRYGTFPGEYQYDEMTLVLVTF